MAALLKMDTLVELLETYRGRDKIVRLLTYLFFISSSSARKLKHTNIEKKLSIIAQELSNLRVLTRLFDDLAMLKWSCSYGLGSKEKDIWCRSMQVIQNLADQSYYPLEHIAWARDVGILKGKSDHFWSVGCGLWVTSLSMGIMTAIRKLLLLRAEEITLKKEECLSAVTNEEENSHQMFEIKEKRKHLLIGLCEYTADLINGIHWLPAGFLWANKLPQSVVGTLGTISSLCQLYKTINPLVES